MISRSYITFCCVLASYGLLLAGCAAPMQKVKVPPYQEPVTVAPKPMAQPTEQQTVTTDNSTKDQVEPAPLTSIEQNLQPESETRQWSDKVEPLNNDRIAQRLKVYEDKLWNWQSLESEMSVQGLLDARPPEWDACLVQLERLASNYSQLSNKNAAGSLSGDSEAACQCLKKQDSSRADNSIQPGR